MPMSARVLLVMRGAVLIYGSSESGGPVRMPPVRTPLGTAHSFLRWPIAAHELDGRSLSEQPLEYTAAAVPLTDVRPDAWTRYLDSLSEGVGTLTSTLEILSERCPRQRFVLAGYSQGAIVIHQALVEISQGPRRGLLRRIDAVA